jgi:hypothetical protein
MQGLTQLGSPGALSVLFAIVVACLVLGKLRDPAAWLVIVMSGALISDVTLKFAFHRARPVPFFGTAPTSYSLLCARNLCIVHCGRSASEHHTVGCDGKGQPPNRADGITARSCFFAGALILSRLVAPSFGGQARERAPARRIEVGGDQEGEGPYVYPQHFAIAHRDISGP